MKSELAPATQENDMNATLVSHRALRLLAIALAAFAFAVVGGLNRAVAQEIEKGSVVQGVEASGLPVWEGVRMTSL